MKAESKRLSTADLAQAGVESSPPEPIADHPGVNIAGSNRGVPEPERATNPQPRKEEPARSENRAPFPAGTTASAPGTGPADTATAPLFEPREADDLRGRWNDIQVGFVDEPRTAVEHADSLVAETVKRLAESFAASRQKLESEWGKGGNASTETLRLSLQRYRSFFNRLLSI